MFKKIMFIRDLNQVDSVFSNNYIKNRALIRLIYDSLNFSIFDQKTTYRLNGADAGNFIFKLLMT